MSSEKEEITNQVIELMAETARLIGCIQTLVEFSLELDNNVSKEDVDHIKRQLESIETLLRAHIYGVRSLKL